MPAPPGGLLAARVEHTRPLVLVLEDEPDIAAFLGAFFRASGLDLSHLSPVSVAEVQESIARLHPSCVLLDIGLSGGLSGFDVLAALQRDGLLDELPVVVLSARGAPEDAELALGLGARHYHRKPFSVTQVFASVEALIAGNPAPADDPLELPAWRPRATAARSGAVATPRATPASDADHVVEHLEADLDTCAAKGLPCAIAFVRADRAGDQLVEVRKVLRFDLPENTVLPTGQAEELVVIAPGLDPARLADLLSAAVADVGLSLGVALRAGIAGSPDHGDTASELLGVARRALGDALRRGPVVTARARPGTAPTAL